MPGENELLSIQPSEVKFPFELKKQISCTLCLVNKTDKCIAFKVKTTSPKNYFVRPNAGLVLPQSSSDVLITMQAQLEAPPDMQCKDKFLVQSVIAPSGTTAQDVSQELFNKEAGKDVHEARLRVLFVAPPQRPSPVTESTEEYMSPRIVWARQMTHDVTSKDVNELKAKLIETRAEHGKMTAERDSADELSQRLQRELANMVGQMDKTNVSKGNSQTLNRRHSQLQRGFSFLFVLIIGILGILLGYLIALGGRK